MKAAGRQAQQKLLRGPGGAVKAAVRLMEKSYGCRTRSINCVLDMDISEELLWN
jgi:hypothetical protein